MKFMGNGLIKILSAILALGLFLSGCGGISKNVISSQQSQTTESLYVESSTTVEKIALPCDSYWCDGKSYTEVEALFKDAGYTNIKTIAQQGDVEKETRVNNSVIAVSVNDNIIFSQNTIFNCDAEIKIYYILSKVTENTASQTDKASESKIIDTESDSNSQKVWITENGTKYHNKSTCSGMLSPQEVSKTYAEEMGYEPCKRCCK